MDAKEEDYFGYSVSASGDTVIVGAYGTDDDDSFSGAAYIFAREGLTWPQQAKLLASDGEQENFFGNSVSVSGDTAIVGAVADRENGFGSGAAYVFVREGVTWSQQEKLSALDADVDDRFGQSVSVSGDTAIVGAYGVDDSGTYSGAAYIFVRDGDEWSQQEKLTPSDSGEYHYFGFSVSVSGDTAIVGAYQDDDVAGDAGAAYVFLRDGEV